MMVDTQILQRQADLILTGYLTRRFTPQDAAHIGWTPERYIDELWPIILSEYEDELDADDLQRLREAMLEKVRKVMEE